MAKGQGKSTALQEPSGGWRVKMAQWRNRILASRAFQQHAAANPLLRPIARKRAGALFDLLAGFTYTQTLLATVEAGWIEQLFDGPVETAALAAEADLGEEAATRLLRAAAAIGIAQEAGDGWWMLGRHGAALHGNEGALAMIRHHRLLYADLADPLGLLRADRVDSTELSRFWGYAGRGEGAGEANAAAYSQLMSGSQAAVSQEILSAYDLSGHASLLDVGGGRGTFLASVARAHPGLRLGLFDLPEVLAGDLEVCDLETHSGSFLTDDLPRGYDCISLVRILHDHDDESAMRILINVRKALAPGKVLLVGEPMSQTRGAAAMGDGYFGLYLWAMGQGRPRAAGEIRAMLSAAGFSESRRVPTQQPLIASLIVARA